MSVVTAAVMTTERPDSRLPHILDRLRALAPAVVRDEGNPWKTARAAWAAAGPDATHHLVVQDDVRIAAVLPAAIAGLTRSFPDAAFAFYAQGDTNCGFRVRMGAFGGDRLVEASGRDWIPAQALLLPRHLCDALASMPADADRDDDEVLAALLFRSRLRCRVGIAVPNLVEHDDDPAGGFNRHDGLRRAACFAGEQAPWQAPARPAWDGPGWAEVSVVLGRDGTRLDWGVYDPGQPRRLRQIYFPWRVGVPHAGLSPVTVAELAEQLVADAGPGARMDGAVLRRAALFEYAVAAVLHGVAWRNWWRGGRPAAALVDGALPDAALAALWRSCGALPAVPDVAVPDVAVPDVLVPLGHAALRAGTELTGVAPREEFHERLSEWFHATRWALSRPLWSRAEQE
jgi:hypothetical protein